MGEKEMRCVRALRICHSNEDCRDCEFMESDRDEMSCVNILFENAAEIIESLSEQLESAQPEWISVEERKPKVGEFVLFQYAKNAQNPTMHARNTMAVGRYEYGMFLVEGCSVKVTHWMPLPSCPEEK